jgi:hypothetical protein
MFSIFNNYSYRVNKNAEKLNVQNKLVKGVIKDNPFYTKDRSKGIILNKNRAIAVRVDGKRFYLVDISKQEGKNVIISKCNTYRNTREYVYIGSIMPYIERLIKIKKEEKQ